MIDDALREELSALIDGALPEERAKELRRRIREEPELFREYAELERTVLAVRALPRTPAPPELRGRVRASLRGPRSAGRVFRIATLAAAAVVLVALSLGYYLRDGAPAQYEARKDRVADDRKPGRDVGKLERKDEAVGGAPAAEALERAEAEADEGARAPEDAARDARPGAPNEQGAKRAAPVKKEQVDLLAAVAKSRQIPASGRKAYLRQVAALGPEEAREHVRAVFGDAREESDLAPAARDAGRPVLATILLEDREEANLVKRILGTAPAQAPTMAASVLAEEEAKDQVTTEIEGPDDDLRRLARWLALLDLAPPAPERPKVTVFGEARRQKQAEPETRSVVVRLRFGKPPEPAPAPEEAAPTGK